MTSCLINNVRDIGKGNKESHAHQFYNSLALFVALRYVVLNQKYDVTNSLIKVA